jgi:hypothetical protein
MLYPPELRALSELYQAGRRWQGGKSPPSTCAPVLWVEHRLQNAQAKGAAPDDNGGADKQAPGLCRAAQYQWRIELSSEAISCTRAAALVGNCTSSRGQLHQLSWALHQLSWALHQLSSTGAALTLVWALTLVGH